jgi:hypothetical protein
MEEILKELKEKIPDICDAAAQRLAIMIDTDAAHMFVNETGCIVLSKNKNFCVIEECSASFIADFDDFKKVILSYCECMGCDEIMTYTYHKSVSEFLERKGMKLKYMVLSITVSEAEKYE